MNRTPSLPNRLIVATRELSVAVDALTFGEPVACTYNPLDYAWAPHEEYLRRYASTPKRVLFLGMNPGPFGMAQTGIPFGEINAVQNWLGIYELVNQPKCTHPKRPIEGFECTRSEVSGRRLWGLFKELFGTADAFFTECFVANYCPLVWMTESGSNLTPDKLPRATQQALDALCLQHLSLTIELLRPSLLIGVGAYATDRLRVAAVALPNHTTTVGTLLHPSPASPTANREWPAKPMQQLRDFGIPFSL